MTKEYRVSIVYDREKQFENNVSVHDAMCDVVQCQTWQHDIHNQEITDY